MEKLLVTGASGFLGNALLQRLVKNDHAVRASVRNFGDISLLGKADIVKVDGLAMATNWSNALAGIDVVVHCAARVHVMQDNIQNPLTAYREVNVDGTLALARQAAQAGVRRFVFVSSIGVNGNTNNFPFTEKDMPNPIGPYAQSKWEGEQGLQSICQQTSMELVIIRPPLVYGPNAPGNFGKLVRWVTSGVPLPLGAIQCNRRSLVALDNLVDFLALCADRERSPNAANELFLISDNQDISTTELLHKVAQAFGVKVHLLSVPLPMLRFFAQVLGKSEEANRLWGSLSVDSSKARTLLGWKPVVTIDDQLRIIAKNVASF